MKIWGVVNLFNSKNLCPHGPLKDCPLDLAYSQAVLLIWSDESIKPKLKGGSRLPGLFASSKINNKRSIVWRRCLQYMALQIDTFDLGTCINMEKHGEK